MSRSSSGCRHRLPAVPLPQSLLRTLAPYAIELRSLFDLTPAAASVHVPISLVPRDTAAALGVFGAAAAVFLDLSRQICERGGAGRIVRGVAMIGLIASLAAIIQRSQSRELIYGIWRPLDAGARPYGPFVNRNHFATWVIMACPLVFGYLLARASPRRPQQL